MCAQLLSHIRPFAIPWTVTCQASLSMGFSRQELDMEQQTGSLESVLGKGVHQGCILSSCLFNLYAEYIMRDAGLEEAQAGIKIARRNISNLRYAYDTTFMAESEEELEPLDENERE